MKYHSVLKLYTTKRESMESWLEKAIHMESPVYQHTVRASFEFYMRRMDEIADAVLDCVHVNLDQISRYYWKRIQDRKKLFSRGDAVPPPNELYHFLRKGLEPPKLSIEIEDF